jgi:hypothetical protein
MTNMPDLEVSHQRLSANGSVRLSPNSVWSNGPPQVGPNRGNTIQEQLEENHGICVLVATVHQALQ